MADVVSIVNGAVKAQRPRLTVEAIWEAHADPTVSEDKISNMLIGRTKLSLDVAETVRKLLSKPAGWPWNELAPGEKRFSLAGTPLAKVRVVGTVGAGPGTYNVDYDERTIWVPANLAAIGGLGFVVEGDSMMPLLDPGTVAIFRESKELRRGFAYLVKLSDGSLAVKRATWRKDEWSLESLNPRYEPVTLKDTQVQGYMVGWYRAVGTREQTDSDPNGLQIESP